MGCCSSKAQLDATSERGQERGRNGTQESRPLGGGGRAVGGGGGSGGREPTAAEKRARAAEAAEMRKTDWRQGGNKDADKARAIAQRREKDELLAKVYNRYTALGREPPIGLPSCDMDQLRRHLETLR